MKNKKNFNKGGIHLDLQVHNKDQNQPSSFNRGTTFKPSFSSKSPPITNDFEKENLQNKEPLKDLKEIVKIKKD